MCQVDLCCPQASAFGRALRAWLYSASHWLEFWSSHKIIPKLQNYDYHHKTITTTKEKNVYHYNRNSNQTQLLRLLFRILDIPVMSLSGSEKLRICYPCSPTSVTKAPYLFDGLVTPVLYWVKKTKKYFEDGSWMIDSILWPSLQLLLALHFNIILLKFSFPFTFT